MAGEGKQVRGRGSCKFASAFGGSSLLSWTSDDPNSKPSKEALNPSRGDEPIARRLPPPPPPPAPGRGPRRRRRDGSAQEGGLKGPRRRRLSEEEASRGRERKARRDGSDSQRRRRSGDRRKSEPRRTKWVRVVNVPTVVQSQHLQHLFKTSLGRVVSCSVDDGIASVCFDNSEHAEKAVEKYDGGEINGCTISVQLDFTPRVSTKTSASRRSPERRSRGRRASQSPMNGRRR